jgi:esterase/lipase
MIGRLLCGVCMVALGASMGASVARAQDVPGIEICTVEKTMERRTSCLQSNVEFLQKTIAKLALDHQQRLDSANRQIEALKANVATLQKAVDDLKAAQAKTPDNAKKVDTPPKEATKDTAKDAPKEGGK